MNKIRSRDYQFLASMKPRYGLNYKIHAVFRYNMWACWIDLLFEV